MKRNRLAICLCASLTFACYAPQGALAENIEGTANYAVTWNIVPKAGNKQEFEQALKEHFVFRSNNGDVRIWQTYVPVIGNNMSHYRIWSCCIRGEDLNGYQRWSHDHAVPQDWADNVEPHVQTYSQLLSTIDYENSTWPSIGGDFQYLGVTEFHPRMSRDTRPAQTKERLRRVAAAGGWNRPWVWTMEFGGEGRLILISPYASYAEIVAPENKEADFGAEHLDSRRKLRKAERAFSKSLEGSNHTIYRLDEEISMTVE